MSKKSEPQIRYIDGNPKEQFSKFTFWPDWERFGSEGNRMTCMTSSMEALFKKRSYEAAATTDAICTVLLNG